MRWPRRATDLSYTEVRRFPSPGGFSQQHVLVGRAPGGPLRVPAVIRWWVDGNVVTRIEEYLDTRQVRVLAGP